MLKKLLKLVLVALLFVGCAINSFSQYKQLTVKQEKDSLWVKQLFEQKQKELSKKDSILT